MAAARTRFSTTKDLLAVAGRVQGLVFTPNEIPLTDNISFK